MQKNKNQNKMSWEKPIEKNEPAEEKQVCEKCGNDTFRVYIKIIIDDARLYCAKCGEFHL
jgi:ribosomal protein S27AE